MIIASSLTCFGLNTSDTYKLYFYLTLHIYFFFGSHFIQELNHWEEIHKNFIHFLSKQTWMELNLNALV